MSLEFSKFHYVPGILKEGRRDELVGGELKRSQGERPPNKYESFDARVLGNGAFVDGLKEEEMFRDKMKSTVTLAHLVAAVATVLGLESDAVRKTEQTQVAGGGTRNNLPSGNL